MTGEALPTRDPAVGSSVLVERMAPGGSGLLRLPDGRVAFARGVVPGDWVTPESIRSQERFAVVDAWQLDRPSPDRVVPQCPHAATCGGCDWMQLAPELARREKVGLLEQALRRTGGFADLPAPIEWVASPQQWGYRRRIRLHLARGRVGFLSAQSHQLVPVDQCPVAAPPLAEALAQVAERLAAHPEKFRGWDQLELELRASNTRAVGAHFIPERGAFRTGGAEREALDTLQRVFGPTLCISSPRFVAAEKQEQAHPSASIRLRPGVFSQVNPGVNRWLVAHVLDVAAQSNARSFLDLYCGNGNFSLPLLAAGLKGLGVEQNAASLELARKSYGEQRQSGWGEGDFVVSDCARWVAQSRRAGPWDLVVVDPPRAGAKPLLSSLPRSVGSTLIMISCDPVTLARDLRRLCDLGFRIQTIHACDMFPQTHHLESCVVLSAAR